MEDEGVVIDVGPEAEELGPKMAVSLAELEPEDEGPVVDKTVWELLPVALASVKVALDTDAVEDRPAIVDSVELGALDGSVLTVRGVVEAVPETDEDVIA